MRKRMMSILVLFLLIVLVGCATARGIAQDTENLARGIKKTIAESE
jgi:predicted small secreted protein